MTTLADFRSVRARIQPHIRRTPVVPSDLPDLFLKLENLQHTRSFKVRGAFARVLELRKEKDSRRILTVSAGNHGQAIARAAAAFGVPCTVVVPGTAAKTKIAAIEKYGVDLRLEGTNYDEAEAWTLDVAKNEKDYAFVSPYDNRSVILGQGSLAFEILEDLPRVAAIIVPIGGGGLASGVAAVVKQLRPSVRVVGVQAEASAAIYHSLKAGRMVKVPGLHSIADGIAGNIDLNTMTFPLIRQFVDDVVLVSESEIRAALRHLLEREKLLVEGAAACAFAAAAAGKVAASGPTVAVMTGGNVDLESLC